MTSPTSLTSATLGGVRSDSPAVIISSDIIANHLIARCEREFQISPPTTLAGFHRPEKNTLLSFGGNFVYRDIRRHVIDEVISHSLRLMTRSPHTLTSHFTFAFNTSTTWHDELCLYYKREKAY